MMISKKIVSWLTSISIVASLFGSITGYASNEMRETYVIDNYVTGTGIWKANEVNDAAYKATITNEDGAVKYTTAAKNDYAAYENGNAGGIIRKINGDEGIGFDNGQKVVIKTRVKKTGDSALRLAVNRPDDGGKVAEWNAFTYVLAIVNADKFRYPTGFNGNKLSMGNIDLSYYDQTNKWIDITITLDGTNNTADYSFNYEYNAEGKRTTTEKTNISLSRPANCAINADTKIKSISFVTTGGNNANENIYIDYLEVYAIVPDVSEAYINENYNTGTGFWKVNEVKDTAYKATFTNEDGAVKYTTAAKNDYTAYENGNAEGIIRKINGDEGIGFDDGQKVVIKTRVKKTGDSTLRLAVNRPDDGGKAAEWNAFTYVLAAVNATTLRYPIGINGSNSSQLSMTNINPGYDQTNKWIDITITLDGTNNKADYTFNYEYNAESQRTTITRTDVSLSRPTNCAINADTKIKSISFITNGGSSVYEDIYIDYLEVYVLKRPIAQNLSLNGYIFPGQQISARYDYDYEVEEGASVFEWYIASNRLGPWTKINGENGKTLTISNDMAEKFIKYKVTPISKDNTTGKTFESNAFAYECAPSVSGLGINSSAVYIGMVTTAVYEYSDINGDEEGATLIEWQIADNESGEWTKIGEERKINLPENTEGKYLRFIVKPVSVSQFYPEGETVMSEVYGPIANILDVTNEFENPGTEEITDKWEESVTLEANNRYIISCMVKKAYEVSEDMTDFGTYIFDSDDNEIIKDTGYETESAEEWTNIVTVADIDKNDEYKVGFMSFAENSGEALIDNMYCGKVQICDIDTIEPESVEIPEKGSIKVPVVTGKVFNQLGTTDGLEEEEVIITAEKDGVFVDGKNIVVDSTAVTGKLEVNISCMPSYPTTVQEEFIKVVTIELTAPENNSPRVSNVAVEGEIKVGNTLYGRYDFYQVEGKDDASEFMWLFSEEEDWDYDIIPGATENKFVVTDEYKDKFIKFVVVPKTSDGLKGEEKISDEIIPYLPPAAKNIKVSGDFKVGGEIKGSYDYSDINGDAEGVSIFKWYISDSENGEYTEIGGENSDKLIFTDEMIEKYLKFSVTPVSEAYPEVGTETFGEVFKGPVAPYITDLTIERKNNNIIYANYKYHHEYNARESGTLFEWTVDGSVVSNEASYVVDFTGTKKVSLTVTPGGDTNPKFGTPVSVSENIKGKTKTSGGGGGGSSSGGIAIVNKTDVTQNVSKEFQLNDLSGHWGADYIKNMVMCGVMTADENGKYNPDKIVTREEMVTYLFKALKLKKSEYKDRFEDVADGEFANILQTMVNNGTIAKDVKFRPNDNITREEMCKILYISLNNAGKLKEAEDGLINSFSDFEEISEWAVKYVNTIYANKIMMGVSETHLAPRKNVTKAQVATMITRTISYIEGE